MAKAQSFGLIFLSVRCRSGNAAVMEAVTFASSAAGVAPSARARYESVNRLRFRSPRSTPPTNVR